MKPTPEILERIEKCSSEHKDGVFTRLYRYLLREDIYYAAYQKLYANKGATTQGIDNDTADGFSDFYVKELIQSLKDGTYKANPVRREYIPKKNGKKRPLSIPTMKDRAMQTLHKMALEPVTETLADGTSYGFRPNRCVQDAIEQGFVDLARKTAPEWVLEGDIKGCFDNINHEWMQKNIPMDKEILHKFLKAGFVEKGKLNATDQGTPQGGLCRARHKPPYDEIDVMPRYVQYS